MGVTSEIEPSYQLNWLAFKSFNCSFFALGQGRFVQLLSLHKLNQSSFKKLQFEFLRALSNTEARLMT